MSIWNIMTTIVIALLVILGALCVGLIHTNTAYEERLQCKCCTIEKLHERIDELQTKYDNYECPECPPSETIWNNNTEYIYETIWNNQTIYLDNIHCDITGDGKVDYNDVCGVLHYVNNGLSKVEELFYNKYPSGWRILYDVNRDGVVNLTDVETILEYSD